MRTGGIPFHVAFDELRRSDGAAVAVLDEAAGRSVSRAELAQLADRARAAIGDPAPGAEARTRLVALYVPTSAELVAAVLACWREGRVPVLIDAELAPAEASAIVRRLGLTRALGGTEFVWQSTDGPAAEAPDVPDDAAVLKLTSGTTGEPYAVVVTGAALEAGFAQIASTMEITGSDRNLVPIPLTHSYGFDSGLLALVALGCPAALARGLTPSHLLATGRATRATVLLAVPFLLDVLSRSPSASEALWPELRLVVSAGAPLSLDTRERFATRFGLRPRSFYGATECGGIAFDRAGAAETPEGCVGLPLDGVSIELSEAEEGVGRVLVRSPSVASRYLPEPDDDPTGAAIGDGWFLTADLGRLDERGRVHLLGRVDDAINVGGRKVFPAEVERVIRAIGGVRDVAVVGIDRTGGAAALCAIVVAEPEIDRARVISACEATLARHKVPRTVEFRAELPRNARGKLDRRQLGGAGA